MADILIDPIDHASQEAFEAAEWDRLEAEDLEKPGQSLAQLLTTDADGGAAPKLGLEADLPDAGKPAAPLEPAAGTPASPSPSAAPAVAPPVAKDPMAEMNAAIARLSAQMDANLRQINGKVGGLQSTIQNLRTVQAEAAVAKAAPSAAGPSQQEIAAAAKSPAEWDALKSDFPDWAVGVEKFVEQRLQGIPTAPSVDIAALKQELTQTVHQTLQQQRQQDRLQLEVARSIEAVHPGWQTEINTDTFIGWQNAQARGIKALADSPDPEDAIALLNLYRKDHPAQAAADPVAQAAPDAAQIQAQRRQRLAASAAPNNAVDPGPRSGVTLDDLTDDQYWELLNRQEAQAKRARA
jgi:hypothetical protein